jgi:hypothetical protein
MSSKVDLPEGSTVPVDRHQQMCIRPSVGITMVPVGAVVIGPNLAVWALRSPGRRSHRTVHVHRPLRFPRTGRGCIQPQLRWLRSPVMVRSP